MLNHVQMTAICEAMKAEGTARAEIARVLNNANMQLLSWKISRAVDRVVYPENHEQHDA